MADNKNKFIPNPEPQEELIQRFFAWANITKKSPSEIAEAIGASRGWVTLARQGKIKSVRAPRRKRILEVLGMSQ
jgi:hypothetical protein